MTALLCNVMFALLASACMCRGCRGGVCVCVYVWPYMCICDMQTCVYAVRYAHAETYVVVHTTGALFTTYASGQGGM